MIRGEKGKLVIDEEKKEEMDRSSFVEGGLKRGCIAEEAEKGGF